MAHAVWKGAISWGLVNIPVSLRTGVRESRIHFRMLHGKDKSPVRFDRVCQKEGKVVPWDDLVKGYEYAKGKFVVLTDEDFEKAALEKSRTMDIVDFVSEDDVDDRFFETPYYVLPDKGGEKAYSLLREAMRDSGKMGIAKIILREVQHIAALTVIKDALVLTLMRFADELVDLNEFQFPKTGVVRSQELKMAKMLVENLSAAWSPDKYTDEYRANLMRLIQAKVKGKQPELKVQNVEHKAEVVDLMSRLQESLKGTSQAARRRGRHKVAHRVA